MVLAYHAVITTYGFWLPNDPRGSWSNFVGSWELFQSGGSATKTDTRRSVAGVEHDHRARKSVKQSLKYPPVIFDGLQARAVGHGFSTAIKEGGYSIFACAIMPEHVHLVIGRGQIAVEKIMSHLKSKATARLRHEGRHPLSDYLDRHRRVPSPWAERNWAVYLNKPDDIERAIRYVNDNPIKENKPRQHWSFVVSCE